MGEGIVLGRSTMSKPAVYLVVAGKLNHADFQKAKIAAESLQEFHGNEGLNVTIKAMVPTEWDVFKGNTTRILGGVLLSKSHKAPPLVFLETEDGTPKEYIGGIQEFMVWANERYGYVDTTKDMIYNMKAKTEYKKYREETGRPFVFLELKDDYATYDRIIIELFNDIAPLTAENFRCLCTGERGEKLHYKGTPLHRVVKGGWLQAGDIEPPHSGAGGFSIYGGTFADESFAYPHDQPGVVGIANQGPHTNNSQFYITLKSMPTWDHKYVAFGRVIEGLRALKMIEKVATQNDRPTGEIIVADCGQLE